MFDEIPNEAHLHRMLQVSFLVLQVVSLELACRRIGELAKDALRHRVLPLWNILVCRSIQVERQIDPGVTSLTAREQLINVNFRPGVGRGWTGATPPAESKRIDRSTTPDRGRGEKGIGFR